MIYVSTVIVHDYLGMKTSNKDLSYNDQSRLHYHEHRLSVMAAVVDKVIMGTKGV
jgi:hypothetical protein